MALEITLEDSTDLEAIVDDIFEIAADIHDWDWADLAKKAGLAKATVYNLGNRKTRLPQFRTVNRLIRAVSQGRATVPQLVRKRGKLQVVGLKKAG